MTDPAADPVKRPVLEGLAALLAVALVLGVIGAVGILMGVKVAGVGGGGGSSDGGEATAGGLYLPDPPTPEAEETTEEEEPAAEEPEEEAPTTGITLTAAQESVAPMQQIDLTGSYPAGEGAILQVQRLENGDWADFPVTMSVSSQRFATYVMTSRPGDNTFRVIDTDTQVTSNEVTVTIG